MVDVVREKINIDKILQTVEHHGAGGVVVFIGRVRDHADGRQVVRMEYEGYEKMAKAALQKIAEVVKRRWPVKKFALVHRLGMLELGEVSVVIAIACAHRGQAFEACQYTIDLLKKSIPIWKKEYGPDGASWVEGVIPERENITKSHEEDKTS